MIYDIMFIISCPCFSFFESTSHDVREFGIVHFAGKVLYEASDFLVCNRDLLSDDIISIFSKHCCSFGFVTHLFNPELKVIQGQASMWKCLHYAKLSRAMRPPWVDRFLNNEIYCYPLSKKRCGPPVAIPSDRLAGGDRNLRPAAT